jgi:hypothetical protein
VSAAVITGTHAALHKAAESEEHEPVRPEIVTLDEALDAYAELARAGEGGEALRAAADQVETAAEGLLLAMAGMEAAS